MVNTQKTATETIEEWAVNAILSLNATINYLRVFPPTSATTDSFVQKTYESLSGFFEKQDSIVFAEAERDLLVCSKPLSEKRMKKPQIKAFLDLFVKFGIRSITFKPGLEKDELRRFLTILTKKPEDLESDGGIQQVMERKDLPHILLNKKIYVLTEKDWVISAGADLNEDIVKYLNGTKTGSYITFERIKEMAKDPKWLSKVIQAGIKVLAQPIDEGANEKICDIFSRMISISKGIEEEAIKNNFLKHVLRHLADMDGKVITKVLSEEYDNLIDDAGSNSSFDILDDNTFEILAISIISERDRLTREGTPSDSPQFQPINSLYEHIMNTGKLEQLQEKVREKLAKEEEQKERELTHVKDGIRRILKGDESVFSDQRLMEFVPSVTKQVIESEKEEISTKIIDRLAGQLSSNKAKTRSLVSVALFRTLEELSGENRLETLDRISRQLINWIERENVLTLSYKKTCLQLQDLAQSFLERHEFSKSVTIIKAFSNIHKGKKIKIKQIQMLSREILNSIANTKIMGDLFKELRTNEENKRKDVFDILSMLGETALNPLLDILLESDSMLERKRILRLIGEIGDIAVPALTNRIKQGGSWYFMRNLAFLLGRLGNEAHLSVLGSLAEHDDVRVQQEVLNSIYKIGGSRRGKVLLSLLSTASDKMKPQIVVLLGAARSREAVRPLLNLISSKSLLPSKARDELEEKVCIALGRIGSQNAIPALRAIAEQKGFLGIRSFSANVKAAAENALAMIRKRAKTEKREKTDEDIDDKDHDLELKSTEYEEDEVIDLSQQEELVDSYVQEGNKTAAIKVLSELVEKYARRKEFLRAEAFKEKLIEVNPMALTEIIRANEIIEEEKSESMDKNHLKIWSNIYSTLSTKEANTLYYAMEEVGYDADEIIFEEGDSNRCLYFINQGQLKMIYMRHGREILLKSFGPGDIVVGDTFLSDSICTTSVITLSRVKLNLLGRESLEKWKEEFPSLASFLNEYCLKFGNVLDLLKEKKADRRSHPRFKISGMGQIQLIDASGKPVGVSCNVSLSDISIGGFSFVVNILNKDKARLLLGRLLNFQSQLQAEGVQQPIESKGTVVSITPHPSPEEYSIHVKFDNFISERTMVKIKSISGLVSAK